MKKERILISGTADGKLRFWNLKDLQSSKYFLGMMEVRHVKGDALTNVATTLDCKRMVTADVAGRIKLWDISRVNWHLDGQNKKDISANMRDIWFIQAHKGCINSIAIVETYAETSDIFVLSASNDQNI